MKPVSQGQGQFLRQIGAVAMGLFTVHIAAPAAVGHDHHDIRVLQIGFQPGQTQPAGMILPVSMQQIENRIGLALPGSVRDTPPLRKQQGNLGVHRQLIGIEIQMYHGHGKTSFGIGCGENGSAVCLPGQQAAAVGFPAAVGFGIAFRADAHDPAECVVKCAVILEADLHGDFCQGGALAH